MEFEKQNMMTMNPIETAESIAARGNSLFSEVDDRRKVVEKDLNCLEDK
jgi:hypothetical protein